jgi:sialic acid synthase SpsE
VFSLEIEIKGKRVGHREAPYIIGEMAIGHQGDEAQARRLIDVAAEAGADAIQFEVFEPDANIVPSSDIHALLKRLYFKPDQWQRLYAHARAAGLATFTFAYDFPSLQLGIELGTDAIKLNSSDLSHPDMLSLCASSQLPTTLGTGASSLEEIRASLDWYYARGGRKVVLMHGVQNFPTRIENAHMRRLAILAQAFDCLVGYADHTPGELELAGCIDLAALGLGAVVLEKHMIITRAEKGVDHESALEPAEFKAYVSRIRQAFPALGPSHLIGPRDVDARYRRFQKKSIVVTRDLSAGRTLTVDDLAVLRTGQDYRLSPLKRDEVVGRRLSRDVKRFEAIDLSHLVDEAAAK